MPAFPTFTYQAADVKDQPIDDVLRTRFEDGNELTRQRFNRVRREYTVSYEHISVADKAALDTFYTTNRALSFTWTHPTDGTTKTVKFAEPPSADDGGWFNGLSYNVSVKLREV